MTLRSLRRRFSRRLIFALVLSLCVHAAFVTVLGWLHMKRHIISGEPQERVSVTQIIRIEHYAPPARPRRTHVAVAAAPKRRALAQMPTMRAAPPTEIARLVPIAPPKPRSVVHGAVGLDLGREQSQFQKTLSKLREENNPLVGSADTSPEHPTMKRYTYDFAASVGSAPKGQGILTPIQSWRTDGYTFYYVRYWVEYPDGTTETGIVPWPLRYTEADDPFRLGLRHLPLPVPLADFRLPTGTSLHPLVAYCYAHRDELASCPIYHQ